MKITNGLQNLYKADAYNQQNAKVEDSKKTNTDVEPQQTKNVQKNNLQDFSIRKVLSAKEISSLNALFGFQQENDNSMYGNHKIRNVHAGMLLDVKG